MKRLSVLAVTIVVLLAVAMPALATSARPVTVGRIITPIGLPDVEEFSYKQIVIVVAVLMPYDNYQLATMVTKVDDQHYTLTVLDVARAKRHMVAVPIQDVVNFVVRGSFDGDYYFQVTGVSDPVYVCVRCAHPG